MSPRLLLVMLLTVAVVWTSQWHWTQTIDEPQHLWAGTRILQQGDFTRFDNSKMPVSVLNAAGWLWSQSPGEQGSWFWARAPQVLWLLGCMGIIYRWVRQTRSSEVALAASALVGLDPNLMAHAGLVTTDLPCTFAVLLACFAWSRWLERDSMGSAVWAGAALGAAQLAKFTALFLGPILGLIALVWCVAQKTIGPLRRLPVVLGVALLVLNTGYAFSGSFTSARDIRWKSAPFQHLADTDVPLPVPKPWIEGVDWVKHDDDEGQGRVYSHGERTHFGRPGHYLSTLPRKFPLPLMVLGVVGLVAMVRRRRMDADTVAAVVAPVFLLVWFSVAFNSQVGSRYVLPAVPFLVLWASHVSVRWLKVGVVWTAVSALSWWPWGLSYFNETVVDRSQAWRIVADSDLDWGQADGAAAEWMQQTSGGLFNPDVPAPGPVLLGANRLTGVLGHPTRMQCYRDHLVPDEHLAGGLYPLTFSARDFAACFPVVEGAGGGTQFPAGDHLLIVRGMGPMALRVDDTEVEHTANTEAILGLVVLAEGRFDASWTVSNGATVYLNGAPIEGVQAGD